MNDTLILSIALVTYNCQKFVSQAMDSILMQKINCDYEIIVADDHSTDNTLQILLEYQKLYPKLIKILNSTHNLGITKNYQRAFKECKGKYIAILEGDDYWISPNKISKQIEFLEQNKDCSFCSHKIFIHNEINNNATLFAPLKKQKFTTKDLIIDNFIGNFSTCMYRQEVIKKIPLKLYDLQVYDWMFNIINSTHGTIGYLLEPLSIYRQHEGGVWSSGNKLKQRVDIAIAIDKYNLFLDKKYDKEFHLAKFKYTKSPTLKTIQNLFSVAGINYILHYILPPICIILINKFRHYKNHK